MEKGKQAGEGQDWEPSFISTGRLRKPPISARQGMKGESPQGSWAEDGVSAKILQQDNIRHVPKWLELSHGWMFTMCD